MSDIPHDATTKPQSLPSDLPPSQAVTVVPTHIPNAVPAHPARIGRYDIVRILGQGGMGTVFEARQDSPRRTVALKVIKGAYFSPQLLRRFEHESQVLGRLQHPGIAQVFEAGAVNDEHGHPMPFFAMEFIQGEPLTHYADVRHLTPRQRLELIARICEAVDHAHQKGVIHRDLKPGNILVDQSGQPKILDFGIARATDSDIKQTTLQTDVGQLIGTVPYMSPEQVSGDPNELDTRSDVYALGVVAYELLAGRLPYDLDKKVIHEAVRVIREEEPSRLSISNRLLRGDIETIVVKALEKNKNRRYQTADAFAADIRRYLKDEPIAARPASTWYQLRKFSRRNRGLVGGVIASFIVLLAGLAATSLALRRALAAEADARQRAKDVQAVSDFQAGMLTQINPTRAGQLLTDDVTSKFEAALTKAKADPADISAKTATFADLWRRVNATDAARNVIDRAILQPAVRAVGERFKDQPLVEAQLRQALSDRYLELSMFDAALPLGTAALDARTKLLGPEHPDTLASMNSVGVILQSLAKYPEAEALFRTTLDARRRVLGEDHPMTLLSISNLGTLYQLQEKLAEAEPLWREAYEKRRRVLGEQHRSTLNSLSNIATLFNRQNKLPEAEATLREALQKYQGAFGKDDPDAIIIESNLAGMLVTLARFSEAEPLLTDVLERRRRLLGEEHPQTLTSIAAVAFALQSQGKLAEAEPIFREAVQKLSRVMGPEHPDTTFQKYLLGVVLKDQGKLPEAEQILTQTLETRKKLRGPDHPEVQITSVAVAATYRLQGKNAEAVALLTTVEPKLRQFAVGPNQRALAVLLTNLGQAHTNLSQFEQAQTCLLEAQPILVRTRGERHKETRDCDQAIIDLYHAWNKAQPGQGYDAKLTQWEETLRAANEPPPSR